MVYKDFQNVSAEISSEKDYVKEHLPFPKINNSVTILRQLLFKLKMWLCI